MSDKVVALSALDDAVKVEGVADNENDEVDDSLGSTSSLPAESSAAIYIHIYHIQENEK